MTPDRLLLRIHADGTLRWRAADGAHGDGAPAPALLAAASEVLVLVPGADVLLTEIDLPRGNAARQAKVLPFALEDQVLDGVDELHFALGPELGGARHVAVVVARGKLDAWLRQLRDAGVVADVVLPDTLALPLDDGAASALFEGAQVLVRLGPCSGFACDAAQLPAWLALHPTRERLHVYAAGTANLPPLEGIEAETQTAAPVLVTLAHGIGHAPAVNLLQGDYAPRHRHAPQRRVWRAAAVLALMAIGLGVLGQVVDVLRLHAANDRVDAAIADIYTQAFPNQPPAADPVARMRSELQRRSGGSHDEGLLLTLARIAPVLRQHGKRLVTLGMEYRNATLELSLRTPDLASLDQLREQLATLPGIHVELSAATPGEDGVEGRLRIRGGGA